MLQSAPSGDYAYRARHTAPSRRPARTRRDGALRQAIRRGGEANRRVYGARKVWRQLRRDGIAVARCTVERLMAAEGLRGIVRGRRVRTTTPEASAERRRDLVQRQFTAARPNQLWVADFTYVAPWRGFVSVAFVIDVFARRIVGGRAHTTMRSDLVLDALEQALHDRATETGLVHHSDRGVQGGFKWSSQHLNRRWSDACAAATIGSSGTW